MSLDIEQRTDVRRQMSEDRCRKTDVRGQMSEDKRQRTDVRRYMQYRPGLSAMKTGAAYVGGYDLRRTRSYRGQP